VKKNETSLLLPKKRNGISDERILRKKSKEIIKILLGIA
jgi:hypothetical protein